VNGPVLIHALHIAYTGKLETPNWLGSHVQTADQIPDVIETLFYLNTKSKVNIKLADLMPVFFGVQ
jgi:hypothetical protein